MLNGLVTGDESWVHRYQPESKRASMQWTRPNSLSDSANNFKFTPRAGKFMLTVFWDSQGTSIR
jgi:uncharacterized damage-inducible protein DinB